MAAVLACGPDALLSHRSAVALWDLRPIPGGRVDVTAVARGRRGGDGICVHNVRCLDPADRSEVDGIPVTSIPRALLDYAEVAHRQQLRHALDAADRLDLLDLNGIRQLFERSRGRHGLKPLAAALAQITGPAPWTQSELERRFLALVREAGIEEPQANVLVAGELVDYYWPRERLVVEVDGYDFHKSRARFADDRRRDMKLQLAGCGVARITEDRLGFDAAALAADLSALLKRRS
jgi:very-short-patch-repair endonuclease